VAVPEKELDSVWLLTVMFFDSGVEAMMGPSEVKAWIVGASKFRG